MKQVALERAYHHMCNTDSLVAILAAACTSLAQEDMVHASSPRGVSNQKPLDIIAQSSVAAVIGMFKGPVATASYICAIGLGAQRKISNWQRHEVWCGLGKLGCHMH
jgi:hypothetical protein